MSAKQPVLRYKVDSLSVVLVLFVLALSLLPLYVEVNALGLCVLVGLLLFFKPIASLVQHNHVHYPIFHSKFLNTAFDLLLAISAGHLCSEWMLHHNIGHHGNRINSREDASSVRHADTGRYMGKLEYIITGSLKIYPDCLRQALQFYRQKKPRFLRVMLAETLFWLVVHAYFLSVNLKMAFFFLLLANVINRALVWLGAYWHHLNVPAENIYNSTNMYTAPFFNLISLNIGYHVAHHERPSLHWSRLKERTAEILPLIPSSHILEKIP